MRFSDNFTLKELTATNTGLPNIPNESQIKRLFYLSQFILQPIRDRWGRYTISSGYRSELVNHAVGGAKKSQHLDGEAADGFPEEADIDTVFYWIVTYSNIKFGKAILERKERPGGKAVQWIHISLPRIGAPNGVALMYENGIYLPYTEQ